MTHSTYAFADRHIGPGLTDTRAMLAAIGAPSLETLIAQAVPQSIRLARPPRSAETSVDASLFSAPGYPGAGNAPGW